MDKLVTECWDTSQPIDILQDKQPSSPSGEDLADGACGEGLQQNARGICLIGLHCCGSLTPTMIKLFVSTPQIHSLVCVSCCYHSLQQAGKCIHVHQTNGVGDMWLVYMYTAVALRT